MLWTRTSFETFSKICVGKVVLCIWFCLQQHSESHFLSAAVILSIAGNVGQREETLSNLAETTSLHALDSFTSRSLVFEFDLEVIASLPYRRAQASITQYEHNEAEGLALK